MCKEDIDHLINAIKEKYELTEDWDGDLYCSVGNLPKGYIRNVPLPRVPRDQSTFQSRVPPVRHTLPRYYEDTYAIPMYSDTYRIGERVA